MRPQARIELMHLYMLTRGCKHLVDRLITQLQGIYLPYKLRQRDGKQDHTAPLYDSQIPLQIRPIQMWEVVFPEECKDVILTTLLAGKKKEQTQHKKHNKFLWAIRKALGCEPIPEYDSSKGFIVERDFVETVGIGIKKDYWIGTDGKHYKKKIEGSYEGL